MGDFGIKQIKYIGAVAKCPMCSSTDIQFKLPFEARIETVKGEVKKLVLDFSNPTYWLKTTMSKCSSCNYEFHLRDHYDNFDEGLDKASDDEGDNISKWYYDFDSFKKI